MNQFKNDDELSFGSMSLVPKVVTSDITMVKRPTAFLHLNNSSTALAVTIDSPKPGWFLVISQKDSGTAGHAVTLTSGTYNGTNNVATFNAANETLVLFGISSSRFIIVENVGSVAFS